MGIHKLIQNTQLKSVTMWRWGDIAKKKVPEQLSEQMLYLRTRL